MMAHTEGAIYISAETSENSETAYTIIFDNFFYNNQATPILNATM
jgi:hypothetical protein